MCNTKATQKGYKKYSEDLQVKIIHVLQNHPHSSLVAVFLSPSKEIIRLQHHNFDNKTKQPICQAKLRQKPAMACAQEAPSAFSD